MLSSAAVRPPVETEERVFSSASSRPTSYSHLSFPSAAGPSARRTAAPVSDGSSFSSSLPSSLPPSAGATSSHFPAASSSSVSASAFPPYSSGVRTREKDPISGTTRSVGGAAAVRAPTGTAAAATHRGGGAERSRMKTGSSILLPSREKFQPAAGPLQYLQMRSAFLYTPSFVAPLPSVPLPPKFCAYTLKRSAICGATSAATPALAVAAAVHSRLGSSSVNAGGSATSNSSSSTSACSGDSDTGKDRLDTGSSSGTAAAAAAAGDVTIFDVAASRQLLQTFDAAGLLLNLINPKGYPQLLAVPPPPTAAGALAKNSEEQQTAAPAGKSPAALPAAATLPACVAALPAEDLELVNGVLPECASYLQQQRQQQHLGRHGGRGGAVDGSAPQRRRGGAAAAANFDSSSNREQQTATVSGHRGMQDGQAKQEPELAAAGDSQREAKGRALASDTLHDQSAQAVAEYRHPTKPHLRPRRILTVVPSRQLCGNRYLQVGIDLPRNELDALAEEEDEESATAGVAIPVAGGEEKQQQQQHIQPQADQQRVGQYVTEQQSQVGQPQEQQQQEREMKQKQAAPASLLLVNSSSLTHVSYAYYMKIGEQEQPSRATRQLPSPCPPAAAAPETKQRGPSTDEGHEEGLSSGVNTSSSSNSSSSKVTPKVPSVVEARYRFARDYTCQISRKEGSYRGEKTFLLIIPRNSSCAAVAAPPSTRPPASSFLSSASAAAALESPDAASPGKGKSATLSSAPASPPRATVTATTAAGGGRAGRGGGGTASTGFAYVVPLHSHKRILMKAGGCTRRSKVRLLLRQPSEKEKEALAERRTAWLGGSGSPSKLPQRTNGVEEEPLASTVTVAVGAPSTASVGGGGDEESSGGSVQRNTAAKEGGSQETASQKEEEEVKSTRAGDEAATPSRRSRHLGRSKGGVEITSKDSDSISSSSASSSSSTSAKKQKGRAAGGGRRAADRSHSSSGSAAAAVSEEEEPQLFREDNGADKEQQDEEEDEEEDDDEDEEEEEEEEEEESSSSGSGSSSSSKSDEDDD